MREKLLRIILVDDMESAKGDVSTGLESRGIPVEVTYFCPNDRNKPLGGLQLPTSQALDYFDLALIDLELFPPGEPHDYDPDDLRGGTEILPFFRTQAPWLPVIAYSHLFGTDSRHFLPIACGFGFDGHVTRGMFTAKWFTYPLWKTIYERSCLQAKRRQIGDAFTGNELIEVDPPSHLLGPVISEFPSFIKLVKSVFYFGKKIVLEQLPGGWSGSAVFRAFVTAQDEKPGREGTWLLKVSKSPWDLNHEAQAHFRMMRSGLEFARMVPLLWHGIAVEDNVAGIAYQFAKDTEQAAQLLVRSGAKATMDRIAPMISQFHAGAESDRTTFASVLNRCFPYHANLKSVADELRGTRLAEIIECQINFNGKGDLAKSVPYRRCLLHGDLHLGNIMLGKTDVFIDFAHSASGPVAFDLACLVADFLIRDDVSRKSPSPRWATLGRSPMASLQEEMIKIGLGPDDGHIFNMLLAYCLGNALRYSIPESTKDWIKQELRLFDPLEVV